MIEDDLKDLIGARAALVDKRLTLARTMAAGKIPDGAVQAIVEVQQAIEVIDIAIEELEEAALEEELEDADEDET